MSIWGIIPAKDPELAKSRLAAALSPAMRRSLSMRLLERTLRAVEETEAVARCLVISAAKEPLSIARQHGAMAVLETGRRDEPSGDVGDALNGALQQAAAIAMRGGATALLILPSDLPHLDAAAIEALVALLPEGPGLVIAPDRHRQGTNALLVRPPLALPFLFGPQSFIRHQAMAAARGLSCVIHDAPAFALDLDTPGDLDLLRAERGPQPAQAGAPMLTLAGGGR